MDYTNKYHLPQWEKSDRILMDDFNQMCLNMEAGLEKVRQDAASNASSAAGSASAAANAAQSTADSAVAKADAAQAAADAAQAAADNAYSPSFMPHAVGTYTGNGSTQTISLGFRPSFVIVTNNAVGASGAPNMVMTSDSVTGLTFTYRGFDVKYLSPQSAVMVNTPENTYSYIAFR